MTLHQSARMLALTFVLVGLGACGDDDPTGPAPTGNVEVTTSTTGASLDADGYSVSVAGGTAQAIGLDETVAVSGVATGSRTVELTGVAANCAVAGDNPRDVTVTDGATVTTTFDVTCAAVGTVEVTTVTTGGTIDPDGFSVSVAGGPPQAIGVDETAEFAGIPAGAQSVELTGVAGNCTVAGANPRDVNVVADATTSTQFDVSCITPISDQIVFLTERDGNVEVYAMDEDGSNPTNLTNDPGNDLYPSVSPDGTRILFISDRDGNNEIYVMDADGSNQTNLTNDLGDDQFGSWSPDGSQILFTSNRDGTGQIYVMNADGSGVTDLTQTPAADHAFSHWSPDGTQILFATNRDTDVEIYVMDADGSNQTNLTNEPGEDVFPAWSPDGTQILFTTGRDGDGEVYVMNADGSGQTNLSNSATSTDQIASWSPDGTEVLFTTNRDGDQEIYVMNADGSGQTNVSNTAASAELPGYPQAWR